jgi:hypothetical protein
MLVDASLTEEYERVLEKQAEYERMSKQERKQKGN